jgi:hypothetical protein
MLECSRLHPAILANDPALTQGLRFHASIPLYFRDRGLGSELARLLARQGAFPILPARGPVALQGGYLWHEFGDLHLILP